MTFFKIFEGLNAVSAHVVKTRSGRSRGYGFVEFGNEEDQLKAKDDKDETEVEGSNGARKISVKVALQESIDPAQAENGEEEQEKQVYKEKKPEKQETKNEVKTEAKSEAKSETKTEAKSEQKKEEPARKSEPKHETTKKEEPVKKSEPKHEPKKEERKSEKSDEKKAKE